MSVQSAVFAIISTTPAVTSIIGTSPCAFYPDSVPQGVLVPAAVYQTVGGAPENMLQGPAPADYVRMQIAAWALDADAARALAEAIRSALEDEAALLAQGISCYCIGLTMSTYESETERYGVLYDYGFWIGR
jgi:hypothetical protein